MPILLIVVLVIVVIAGVAIAYMLTNQKYDKLDGNQPSKDTIAIITVDLEIGDFDNQWGKVDARDVSVKTKVLEYDGEEGRSVPFLRMAGWFDWTRDEFELWLRVRCTGPNGFTADAHDYQKITVDDWDWGEREVVFGTVRFFVEDTGTYTLNIEVVVDADGEGVDDETAYQATRTVVVS